MDIPVLQEYFNSVDFGWEAEQFPCVCNIGPLTGRAAEGWGNLWDHGVHLPNLDLTSSTVEAPPHSNGLTFLAWWIVSLFGSVMT